jgi:hypothetical protein
MLNKALYIYIIFACIITKLKAQEILEISKFSKNETVIDDGLVIYKCTFAKIEEKEFNQKIFEKSPYFIKDFFLLKIDNYFYSFSEYSSNYGVMINDINRHRIFALNQENIYLIDTKSNKVILELSKNCGIGSLMWGKSVCGFSNARYDYKNGIVYFDKGFMGFKLKKKLNISN